MLLNGTQTEKNLIIRLNSIGPSRPINLHMGVGEVW
jgi:hypothetical protein